MKIFGEELGGLGRWYIALPLLLIAFLIGLFLLVSEAQLRLNAANQHIHSALVRQQALVEFIATITDAESAQRGYLLTGERSYLERYQVGAPGVSAALEHVRLAYDADDNDDSFRNLSALTGQVMAQLADGVAAYRANSTSAAGVGTDAARSVMDALTELTANLRSQEAIKLTAATRGWEADYSLSRWVSGSGAVLNVGLVVLASSLVYADLLRRARQATELRDRKEALEREVAARTRDLAALSTHLQGVSEQEKSALSRELHDELGGLLVAASMDLSWLEQRVADKDSGIQQRFKRIHESLGAGVDLKRRVVEELRPTLLDNMGLFIALRWQFKESCRRAGLKCVETIPDSEIKFDPNASIAVFRVAQEAFTNILKHAQATSAELHVEIQDQVFLIRVSDDGKGIPPVRLQEGLSHGLASMRHRIAALGGHWEVGNRASGGTIVAATIPLGKLLLNPRDEGGAAPG